MKNLKLLIILAISLSCRAQTYPLKTDYTEVPNNSYLKDINNELNTFVGIYKSTFQGKEITIYLNKNINLFFERGNNKYFKDALSLKYIVKDSYGNILQNTQNMSIPSQQIRHTIFSQWVENNGNTLLLYYGGTNCGVGWGSILLTKINSTQISWEYRPGDTILDSSRCPTGTDITIYLPETKGLIFTKQ